MNWIFGGARPQPSSDPVDPRLFVPIERDRTAKDSLQRDLRRESSIPDCALDLRGEKGKLTARPDEGVVMPCIACDVRERRATA